MKLTVYASKRTATGENGKAKTFYTYLTTLKRKDGTELVTAVKFREICGNPDPEKCPMNIVVEKTNANLSVRNYTNDEGEVLPSYTLWVTAWEEGEPYVDHSLDDFE